LSAEIGFLILIEEAVAIFIEGYDLPLGTAVEMIMIRVVDKALYGYRIRRHHA